MVREIGGEKKIPKIVKYGLLGIAALTAGYGGYQLPQVNSRMHKAFDAYNQTIGVEVQNTANDAKGIANQALKLAEENSVNIVANVETSLTNTKNIKVLDKKINSLHSKPKTLKPTTVKNTIKHVKKTCKPAGTDYLIVDGKAFQIPEVDCKHSGNEFKRITDKIVSQIAKGDKSKITFNGKKTNLKGLETLLPKTRNHPDQIKVESILTSKQILSEPVGSSKVEKTKIVNPKLQQYSFDLDLNSDGNFHTATVDETKGTFSYNGITLPLNEVREQLYKQLNHPFEGDFGSRIPINGRGLVNLIINDPNLIGFDQDPYTNDLISLENSLVLQNAFVDYMIEHIKEDSTFLQRFENDSRINSITDEGVSDLQQRHIYENGDFTKLTKGTPIKGVRGKLVHRPSPKILAQREAEKSSFEKILEEEVKTDGVQINPIQIEYSDGELNRLRNGVLRPINRGEMMNLLQGKYGSTLYKVFKDGAGSRFVNFPEAFEKVNQVNQSLILANPTTGFNSALSATKAVINAYSRTIDGGKQ